MEPKVFREYAVSCFLLTMPVMAWNLALTNKLPAAFQQEIFWNNIPSFLALGENTFRIAIFILTAVMPLSINSGRQRAGLRLYIAGILAYFASWLFLIYFPDSIWSTSMAGFLAPAYTPLFWLTGIALIGNKFHFNIRYRSWFFFVPVIIFLVFHNIHTIIIYNRTH